MATGSNKGRKGKPDGRMVLLQAAKDDAARKASGKKPAARKAAPKQAAKRPPRTAPVEPDVPATERVRRLFLTSLGAVLLIAFWSLWGQLDGLIGVNGILPADAYLTGVDGAFQARGWMSGPTPEGAGWLEVATDTLTRTWVRMTWLPTLAWLMPDGTYGWLCIAGLLASVVVMSGRYVAPALLVAWACYLSLSTMGQNFLNFQWDSLLTEVTFAAVLVAPWGARPRHAAFAPAWWLLRTILFRLVFFGGLVKLTSGDATWRDLSALTLHYETQPLPNPLSWYAHQLPWAVHAGSALLMFLIELVLIWGVFGTRRMRHVAAGSTALLMGMLASTGNYGFFQLLTVVLCLTCLDDRDLRWLTRRLPQTLVMPPLARPGRWAVGVGAAALVFVAAIGIPPRYAQTPLPPVLETVRAASAPWRTVNHYGLFARMTTERPLPILEAKWGDQDWTELTWRYQTSDPAARPPQVAPHMPRLDWQLWFAGLGDCNSEQWVQGLAYRILEGDPHVAALVGDMRLLTSAPPDAVRLVLMDYRFAPADAPSGAWWVRERKGLFCPELRK